MRRLLQKGRCTTSGTTLVISPLISPMADQVAALKARGVAATFLASTLAPEAIRGRMAQIARGSSGDSGADTD